MVDPTIARFIQTVKPGEGSIVKPGRFSGPVKRYGFKAAVITFTSRAFNLVGDALDGYDELKWLRRGILRPFH